MALHVTLLSSWTRKLNWPLAAICGPEYQVPSKLLDVLARLPDYSSDNPMLNLIQIRLGIDRNINRKPAYRHGKDCYNGDIFRWVKRRTKLRLAVPSCHGRLCHKHPSDN